ncbi:MAG: hypothetical protein M9890_14575 [Thermomicrobiales bacterium]|nr:hypothetical protein [Thermomicrobiales bacterium]
MRRQYDSPTEAVLPEPAARVARRALTETRLRGLPAAEEYRVITDRLYGAGFRDFPAGTVIQWIETEVAAEYEHLLEIRALGEKVYSRLASGDLASAAWEIACQLSPSERERLAAGIARLIEHDRDEVIEPAIPDTV